MDTRHLLATASLGATLMMARSPASAIAVLKEVEGKVRATSREQGWAGQRDIL